MPVPLDTIPALLLPAAVLLALAVFMPFTGGRETRRRAAWARFDAVARVKGVSPADREALARWALLACPETPHHALVRRQDFDRFSRSEVQRIRGLDGQARALLLEQLAALRRKLGFDRTPGAARSSHDLVPGEPLWLRPDPVTRPVTPVDPKRTTSRAGEEPTPPRIGLRVVAVDEEGVHVTRLAAGRAAGRSAALGPGWAIFARDGQGTFRFRTAPSRPGVLAHGDFLVHEERRREPRVPVQGGSFWVAVERLPDGAAPEDPEGVEVRAVDVSTGGVALLADREVRRGSILWMDLPLGEEGGPRLRGIRAQVLAHGFREGGGPHPHFLNCSFTEDLTDLHRRVLDAYLEGRLEPRRGKRPA